MERKAYRYGNGGLYFAVAFLFLWSGGWLSILNSMVFSGDFVVNGRHSSVREAMPTIILSELVGFIVLSAAIGLLLHSVVARVEIEGGLVVCYDLLNRPKVRADLSEIESVTEGSTFQGRKATVKTDRGNFSFGARIDGYLELQQRLGEAARSGFVPAEAPVRVPGPAAPLKIEPRTYRYTGSYLHVFSFIWLAACGFIGSGALSATKPGSGSPVPFLLAVFAFASIGIWMQLTGWVERIRVDENGIEWIDFLGRQRVKATLDEIIGLNEIWGRSSTMAIETRQGTVRASSYLWGYSKLRAQVQQIVDRRKLVGATVSPVMNPRVKV